MKILLNKYKIEYLVIFFFVSTDGVDSRILQVADFHLQSFPDYSYDVFPFESVRHSSPT